MILGHISNCTLEALAERGHSHDEIEAMTPERAFIEYCQWHGLLGWGSILLGVIDNLKAADQPPSPAVCKEVHDNRERMGSAP